jgi:hypothetical protein
MAMDLLSDLGFELVYMDVDEKIPHETSPLFEEVASVIKRSCLPLKVVLLMDNGQSEPMWQELFFRALLLMMWLVFSGWVGDGRGPFSLQTRHML